MSLDAGKIYDELPEGAKDMPRAEFVKKVRQLTSPNLMQRDLKAMIRQKQDNRTRQALAAAQARKIEVALRYQKGGN